MLKILQLYREIILLQNELVEARAEIARPKAPKQHKRRAAVPDLDAMTDAEKVAYIQAHPEAVSAAA